MYEPIFFLFFFLILIPTTNSLWGMESSSFLIEQITKTQFLILCNPNSCVVRIGTPYKPNDERFDNLSGFYIYFYKLSDQECNQQTFGKKSLTLCLHELDKLQNQEQLSFEESIALWHLTYLLKAATISMQNNQKPFCPPHLMSNPCEITLAAFSKKLFSLLEANNDFAKWILATSEQGLTQIFQEQQLLQREVVALIYFGTLLRSAIASVI